MKENVIIGKPIPAGTGMKRYRNIKLDSDERMNQLLAEDEIFSDEELDLNDAEIDAAFVDSFDDIEDDELMADAEEIFDAEEMDEDIIEE